MARTVHFFPGVSLLRNAYPTVGMAELDAEHRAIAAGLSNLLEALIADDFKAALSAGRELQQMAGEHFAHEDALMREIRYADRARHSRAHREFAEAAARQLEGAELKGLSRDFLAWASHLDDWFRTHVMTEDMWLAVAARRAREASPHQKTT